jgi:hypothetical protein
LSTQFERQHEYVDELRESRLLERRSQVEVNVAQNGDLDVAILDRDLRQDVRPASSDASLPAR